MPYEIALDIGTTNIQALLIEASSKKQVDYLTARNSSAVYGEDVIARLGRSLKERSSREKINKSIIGDIELIVGLLLKRARVAPEALANITAFGNAAMHHLLLGLPLETLARAPFKPAHAGASFHTSLGKIGIRLPKEKEHRYFAGDKTPFIFLPNLGGFVGSDALCTIIDTKMHKSKDVFLAIDLGTNGEIMLGSKFKILVASTSAGPAFQGWHVKCGVHGSTLVDIIADGLKKRVIDKKGYMKKGSFIHREADRKIKVTQKDVREFQLAKAAIASGISILRKRLGARNIKKIFITGLFGAGLKKSSAKIVGILPSDAELSRVNIKQNRALSGAAAIMTAADASKTLKSALDIIEHVELHRDPDFQEEFSRSIPF